MSKRDYYEILGLAKDATDDEIKKAYRKMAMKHHPDRNEGADKEKSEELFKEAKEAYEILSVPERRAEYDLHGHQSPFTHSTAGGRHYTWTSDNSNHQDLNDVLKTVFGSSIFGDDFSSQRTRQQIYAISLPLTDAYIGRTVTLENGTALNIPKGVRSGTKFYVNGNMYRVDVQAHYKFKRANDDLLVDVIIGAIEAILGIGAVIEHLDGSKLQFTIPPGIQQGQIIKLSGKGMKNPETDKNGDLLIRINIVIPKDLSDAEKEDLKKIKHKDSIEI